MNAPFTPAGRWDIFRAEFAKMTPAEALDALAWLLDPAIGDPAPELPDEITDALQPVYAAYSKAYDGLQGALELIQRRERGERAEDYGDYLYEQRRDDRMMHDLAASKARTARMAKADYAERRMQGAAA